MRLATIASGGSEEAAIATGAGLVPLRLVNEAAGTRWSEQLLGLLNRGELDALEDWSHGEGAPLLRRLEAIPAAEAVYAPPYRHPRKIWGIGANYRAKAADMKVTPPDAEPICFLKPDTSLIGPDDAIVVPAGSGRVTAEAELGIVIGRACKNVTEAEADRFVAGFVPTLDMTDQDVHARNPRFLGRSKSFDTFFSFGPELVTLQEMRNSESLLVETVLNGRVVHSASVSDMIYPLRQVVAYFSRIATLLPGDIIMTGTPGSVDIREGDLAECRIGGFAALVNPVVRESEEALRAALSSVRT